MKFAEGSQYLTLKDVAKAIALHPNDAGVSRTMRQVRHWTQSDVLRTASEKATGSGIPRMYDGEGTLVIAAILLEFARYGATVDILKPLADKLYEDFEDGWWVELFAIDTDEEFIFAQVSWDEDPETGKFTDAIVNFFNDGRLQEGGLSDLDTELTSSIIVNINKINWRIRDTD